MRPTPRASNTALRSLSTIQQVATANHVSERTVRRWIASGLITGYRMGPRLIRLDMDEVERLLRPIPTVGGVA
ncbi:helix-turn-helix domain-containing protein [Jatrophihabitans telluris]|uniref:helix-turn-helix domain-containing protein n=1 Tax=Jatrophihabitans telluris TaxID=2038343 RepID=UPI00322214AE